MSLINVKTFYPKILGIARITLSILHRLEKEKRPTLPLLKQILTKYSELNPALTQGNINSLVLKTLWRCYCSAAWIFGDFILITRS